MRINVLLPITVALSLAACQPAPVVTQPAPQPDPTPVTPVAPPSDTPGSSAATAASLTMLTSNPIEKQGEQLPLIAANAEWVAFQDGTGPWKKLEGTNGAYPFEVTNKTGKYGLAYTCPKPASTTPGVTLLPTLEMRLFTLADTKALRAGCNVNYSQKPLGWTPPTGKSFKITGKITGIEATESIQLQAIGVNATNTTINVAADGTYSQVLEESTYQLLVGKLNKPTQAIPQPVVKKYILARGVNLSADATRNFDFATQGFEPVQKNLTITALQPDENGYLTVSTFIDGTNFNSVGAFQQFTPQENTFAISVIPDNQQQPGDAMGVQAFTNSRQGRDSISKGIIRIGPNWNSSLAIPATPVVQVTAESEAPYARPKLTLDRPIEGTGSLMIKLLEDVYNANIITQRNWNVLASKAWLGTDKSFITPDFSALTGWNPDLGFKKLSDMGWVVARQDGTASHRALLASSGDAVAQREYTTAESKTDFQNLSLDLSSINHPTADKIKPTITNTVPSNLVFTGTADITLAKTKTLEIQFSEEMDIASVIAAYESTSLPASSVTFAWKARFGQPNNILVITPNTALTVGSTYSFTLGTGAKDISGNPLETAKTFSFKVTP